MNEFGNCLNGFERSHSTPGSTQDRSSEIVSGRFKMQSKQKFIPLVNIIIQTEEGNPAVVNDRDAGTSSVNPLKFDSSNDAIKSICKFQNQFTFYRYLPGFWCNFNQSKEKRESYFGISILWICSNERFSRKQILIRVQF